MHTRTILVKAKEERGLASTANKAIETVAQWMAAHHLVLAREKTECILHIGGKYCKPLVCLKLRDHFKLREVEVRTEAKYLGWCWIRNWHSPPTSSTR